jgi:hypothetical protein
VLFSEHWDTQITDGSLFDEFLERAMAGQPQHRLTPRQLEKLLDVPQPSEIKGGVHRSLE